jgi:hypothetical protein
MHTPAPTQAAKSSTDPAQQPQKLNRERAGFGVCGRAGGAVLRGARGTSGWGEGGGGVNDPALGEGGGGAGASTGSSMRAPHLPQYFEPGADGVPHCVQNIKEPSTPDLCDTTRRPESSFSVYTDGCGESQAVRVE